MADIRARRAVMGVMRGVRDREWVEQTGGRQQRDGQRDP